VGLVRALLPRLSKLYSTMHNPRRFPPPWTVEERPACFVVVHANGQQLAYFYFKDEPGRRSERPSCSAVMRRGGSRRILRSCRS
jgi:hypothetical protein